MTKKIAVIGAVAALALASTETQAFAPVAFTQRSTTSVVSRFAEESPSSSTTPAADETAVEAEAPADELEFAEKLGRGAAKVCINVDHTDDMS